MKYWIASFRNNDGMEFKREFYANDRFGAAKMAKRIEENPSNEGYIWFDIMEVKKKFRLRYMVNNKRSELIFSASDIREARRKAGDIIKKKTNYTFLKLERV